MNGIPLPGAINYAEAIRRKPEKAELRELREDGAGVRLRRELGIISGRFRGQVKGLGHWSKNKEKHFGSLEDGSKKYCCNLVKECVYDFL